MATQKKALKKKVMEIKKQQKTTNTQIKKKNKH